MKYHVNLRGGDERGDYTIQTRVEAKDVVGALQVVKDRWAITNASITRLHVEPVKAGDE